MTKKWELFPVLITKNRLFESIGGLYKKDQVKTKKDQVNLYKLIVKRTMLNNLPRRRPLLPIQWKDAPGIKLCSEE